MEHKKCTGCRAESNSQDSFAMELLKGYSLQAKRWFIAFLVILFMWLTTIVMFVCFINQYDFSSTSEEIIVDSSDGGNANYIGNDGDIYNGYSESN